MFFLLQKNRLDDDGDEDDDDNLGRQAGQMNLSLQTSLPVAFTFCVGITRKFCKYSIEDQNEVWNLFIVFTTTFNIAMSFSTAVRLKGRKNRCWRLFFLNRQKWKNATFPWLSKKSTLYADWQCWTQGGQWSPPQGVGPGTIKSLDNCHKVIKQLWTNVDYGLGFG